MFYHKILGKSVKTVFHPSRKYPSVIFHGAIIRNAGWCHQHGVGCARVERHDLCLPTPWSKLPQPFFIHLTCALNISDTNICLQRSQGNVGRTRNTASLHGILHGPSSIIFVTHVDKSIEEKRNTLEAWFLSFQYYLRFSNISVVTSKNKLVTKMWILSETILHKCSWESYICRAMLQYCQLQNVLIFVFHICSCILLSAGIFQYFQWMLETVDRNNL